MQSIRQCMKQLTLYGRAAVNKTDILSSAAKTLSLTPTCSFHSSICLSTNLSKYHPPRAFLRHNRTVFPPQKPDEEKRPAVSYIYYV